ncbi:MAG TPA: Gfo/Idh/MocA family oxidoreductase [Gemmatimonadales bacterium]|nr:Gfo/Idh/MocA family oxidoreductase [Gemmatimonadales bacterium]
MSDAPNPVIAMLGRRLRLAVIGGGPGSFIGETHRAAARMDDRYEIVTGVFSSDPEKSKRVAAALGYSAERAYGTVDDMLAAEAARRDGVEVVAIMTPNDSHFPFAMAALERGLDVICDKPMTNTIEDAEALEAKVRETGLTFCLTHNYTGYPLVRQAQAMVEAGEIGTVRLIQIEYVQGGKADESRPDPTDRWRFDPKRAGPSLVMGDIGSHAHNLVRFVTRLEVAAVNAEIGAIVPGRTAHDYGGALLRMEGGARGSFWVTQAAAGVENSIRFRVSGTKGSLEWQQEIQQRLRFKPLGAPAQVRTPNGPGSLPLALRSSRLKAGHPEGFLAAFANLYSDAAEVIAARRAGQEADPLARHFPNAHDGLMGVRFLMAALESSAAGGTWVACGA